MKGLETQIGKRIEHLVCRTCKDKIRKQTEKLSKWDILKPRKTYRRFILLLCKDCLYKVKQHLKGGRN